MSPVEVKCPYCGHSHGGWWGVQGIVLINYYSYDILMCRARVLLLKMIRERGRDLSMYKLVIVVRADLGMSRGKIVAQAVHAAVEATRPGAAQGLDIWLNDGLSRTIVLTCDSLEHLRDLEAKARDRSVPHALFTDLGLTEFDGVPTQTCIALGPALRQEIDPLTSNLPLLKD